MRAPGAVIVPASSVRCEAARCDTEVRPGLAGAIERLMLPVGAPTKEAVAPAEAVATGARFGAVAPGPVTGDPTVTGSATEADDPTAAVAAETDDPTVGGTRGTGETADDGALAAGTDGADADSDVAAGGGASARGGSSVIGSTYPSARSAVRIPRCTYGVGHSLSPLKPAVPMGSPSTTAAPFATAIAPRCVNDTE